AHGHAACPRVDRGACEVRRRMNVTVSSRNRRNASSASPASLLRYCRSTTHRSTLARLEYTLSSSFRSIDSSRVWKTSSMSRRWQMTSVAAQFFSSGRRASIWSFCPRIAAARSSGVRLMRARRSRGEAARIPRVWASRPPWSASRRGLRLLPAEALSPLETFAVHDNRKTDLLSHVVDADRADPRAGQDGDDVAGRWIRDRPRRTTDAEQRPLAEAMVRSAVHDDLAVRDLGDHGPPRRRREG